MLHKNTVFHGLLKHLPWAAFDRLVEQHRADAGVRRLTTKSQLIALLYGQLSGASSLREIVAGLGSHQARLYHLGARPAHRSTLADADRPIYAVVTAARHCHVNELSPPSFFPVPRLGAGEQARLAFPDPEPPATDPHSIP